jgi:hypothetical protein
MKRIFFDFFRRGLAACGFGPLILAVLYLILQGQGLLDVLTVQEVCMGIFTLAALAFIAGGMNVLYRIERLPLMVAVTIHGSVLYVSYMATYLLNGWLEWGTMPVLVFSVIFVIGYLAIWAVIYAVIKRNTEKLNAVLKQKQQSGEA